MRELVPGPRKGERKVVGFLAKALRNHLVIGIRSQCHVGRGHHGVRRTLAVRFGYRVGGGIADNRDQDVRHGSLNCPLPHIGAHYVQYSEATG